jgi:hypothetical protein
MHTISVILIINYYKIIRKYKLGALSFKNQDYYE